MSNKASIRKSSLARGRGAALKRSAAAKVNGGGEYLMREFPANRKRIDIGDYYSDYDHIHALLGWRPKVPLCEGLRRTLAFYREHLPKYI